jgi:hypothetical protein
MRKKFLNKPKWTPHGDAKKFINKSSSGLIREWAAMGLDAIKVHLRQGDLKGARTAGDDLIHRLEECIDIYTAMLDGHFVNHRGIQITWHIPDNRGDCGPSGKPYKRWVPSRQVVLQRIKVAEESLQKVHSLLAQHATADLVLVQSHMT